MSLWMGVDLGNARVGLALSDPELSVATPLRNVEVDSDYFEALDEVETLASERGVSRVVVGYPLNMDGTEGKAAKKAARWASQLRRRLDSAQGDARLGTKVEVVLQDERLTTVAAHHQLWQAGRSSRSHRQVVDQQSAVLILQSALEAYAMSRGKGPGTNGGQ